jgi:hypothetical protein
VQGMTEHAQFITAYQSMGFHATREKEMFIRSNVDRPTPKMSMTEVVKIMGPPDYYYDNYYQDGFLGWVLVYGINITNPAKHIPQDDMALYFFDDSNRLLGVNKNGPKWH